MKKRIIICIICILTTFVFAGCGGIRISLDSDSKTAQSDNKQQNDGNKSQTASDKTAKQDQNVKDNSPVTVNINQVPQTNSKPDTVIVREPSPAPVVNGSFIFSNSGYSYLTKSQVASLSNYQLGIARNEIYARHGYIFSTAKYRNYFNSQSWYSPITTNVTLSNVETYNVDLIKAEEDRRGVKN